MPHVTVALTQEGSMPIGKTVRLPVTEFLTVQAKLFQLIM
jgi:hypothetical protein